VRADEWSIVKRSAVAADNTRMTDMRMSSGARLLVVGADQGHNQELANALDAAGYREVSVALDGARAAAQLHTASHDLILVDLDAPAASETIACLRPAPTGGPELPVLGLIADSTPGGRRHAATVGVHDFVTRPIEVAELRLRVENALANAHLRQLVSDRTGASTGAPAEDPTEAGTVRESLSLLAAVADFHDDDSDQHAHRVGILSGAIARALGLSEEFAEMLTQAAPLHDIGKVGISRRILLKPGKLTPPEWMHMMQHVDIGGQILASAHSSVLHLAGEIARTHHERWDGSGYTAGLAGEEIPVSGRIVAVADVWDTLTHDRPYRSAWEADRALAEIRAQAGAQFDLTVVEAFCRLDLDTLAQRSSGERLAA
jgi:putative two-component system response regulator